MRAKRRHILMIRVHEGEFAGLKAVAIARGLSVSDHVRLVLGLPSRARSTGTSPVAAGNGPVPEEKPGGTPDSQG